MRVSRAELSRYYPAGRRFDYRLQPLPEDGCIYVRNAKAATSTILLWLHRAHTGDHDFTPAWNIHSEHALPRTTEVGWRRVCRMLDGEAFRFSFVRDPIARCESAYLDKIAQPDGHDRFRHRVRRTLGLPEGHTPTFDQFIAALQVQDPIAMDPHWRPQHLNLMHPLVEYDLVGRVENFAADLALIREATGLPDVPIEVRNRSASRAGSLFDGKPGLLRKARDVYARDFELYGY